MKRILLLVGVAMLIAAGCDAETKSQDGDVNSSTSSTAAAPTTATTQGDRGVAAA